MSNNATDELLSYINTILADYAATCGVEPFNGQIIIADDMRKSYLSLRGDSCYAIFASWASRMPTLTPSWKPVFSWSRQRVQTG